MPKKYVLTLKYDALKKGEYRKVRKDLGEHSCKLLNTMQDQIMDLVEPILEGTQVDLDTFELKWNGAELTDLNFNQSSDKAVNRVVVDFKLEPLKDMDEYGHQVMSRIGGHLLCCD
jgi:hypothetical protein